VCVRSFIAGAIKQAEIVVVLQIIETKVKKLEQLVRLKDAKIQTLISKMQAADLA